MCSIFGILDSQNPDRRSCVIRKMAQDQFHRGPDDGDFFEDDFAALGHRRLSVIDLSESARQPMSSDDGNIVIVFNGEIYNYQVLKKELTTAGHTFRTASDTECIIHAYEEYQEKFFELLDGMFAIAVYDRKKRKVFFGRDRMGKKPLIYFRYGKSLAFASELSALKQHYAMPREFDMQSLSDYLSLLYIPSPATIYKDVYKLPPGSMMVYDCENGEIETRKYYQTDFSKISTASFTDSAEKLRHLVFKAVEKRLMSDVPVGVFLSGGVDSGIVAHVMTSLRAPQKTDGFTIGFDDPAYDERSSAEHMAAFINKKNSNSFVHHEKTVNGSDFSMLRELVKHYGEPYADCSMLPTALLSKFTREKVTVALSGDGADELFGGYDRYFLMSKIHLFNIIPQPLRFLIFKTLSAMTNSGSERSRCGRIKRAFDVISCRSNLQYYRILDRCFSDLKREIAGPQLKEHLSSLKHNSIIEMLDNLSSGSAPGKYLEFDQQTYLPGDILFKTDIASMKYSLELRSPFLDRDVVDFANSLPTDFKIYKNDKKHILKAAFKDMLPSSHVYAGKRGFGVPVAGNLRGDWHDQAYDLIFKSDALMISRLFNPAALRKIWHMHQSSRCDYSYQLLTVMLFAMFLENEAAL